MTSALAYAVSSIISTLIPLVIYVVFLSSGTVCPAVIHNENGIEMVQSMIFSSVFISLSKGFPQCVDLPL